MNTYRSPTRALRMEPITGIEMGYIISSTIGLIAAIFIVYRLLATRQVRIPAKQRFAANPDPHYLNAVKLAMSYGQLSSGFLRNRLKIDKATADELLARLYEKNVVVAPNEGGIAKIVE